MDAQAAIPLPTVAYLDNCRWVQASLQFLANQYPDQWIAVDRCQVIAAGSDLGRVTAGAHQAGGSVDTAYEYIAGGSLVF